MKQQVKDLIHDLMVDIKCADRDGLTEYAEKCRKELYHIIGNHLTLKFDRYGSPVIPEDLNK